LIGDIGQSALLQSLPANLQPANIPFYYDPYDESNQIQQAAIAATGNGSFDPNASYNSQSVVSIANQDKSYLYANTAQFAEQNNIAPGTALTVEQLQLVNAPMLWYVQEAVPQPGCIATGSAACPTVQTLMPEVLLPPNYSSITAMGSIAGQNVSLNYRGGTVTNTGHLPQAPLSISTCLGISKLNLAIAQSTMSQPPLKRFGSRIQLRSKGSTTPERSSSKSKGKK
jgi:filamentous hemagglutinin